MKNEMFVLPVQCLYCGGVFDLWNDLRKGKGAVDDGGIHEHLCSRCREFYKRENEGSYEEQEGDSEFEIEWSNIP